MPIGGRGRRVEAVPEGSVFRVICVIAVTVRIFVAIVASTVVVGVALAIAATAMSCHLTHASSRPAISPRLPMTFASSVRRISTQISLQCCARLAPVVQLQTYAIHPRSDNGGIGYGQ